MKYNIYGNSNVGYQYIYEFRDIIIMILYCIVDQKKTVEKIVAKNTIVSI